VAESLEGNAKLAGWADCLSGRAGQNTHRPLISALCGIVRERSVMRKLVEVGSASPESAFSPQGKNAAQLLDEAEAKIFEIAEGGHRSSQGFIDIKVLLPLVADASISCSSVIMQRRDRHPDRLQ